MGTTLRAMILAFVVSAIVAAQESSLLKMAKEHDVTMVIQSAYEPVTFETLVAESDTIVVGVVNLGRTSIAGDNVVTYYDVIVDRVVRRTQPPGIARGDVLVVRREGGATSMYGHNIVANEADFPQFTIKGTYVLFLKRAQAQPYYWVAWGPQGAFHVTSDSVLQVSNVSGSWNRERGPMSIAAFLDEVRRVSPRR